MSNKFVEKFNFNLISLVETNAHLYNKTIADYKDKVKKENTWKSIAKELRSTRSAGGMTKPPSAYYKALLFLECHVRGRRNTIGNIPGCTESQSQHISSNDEDQDEGDIETLDDDEHVLQYLKLTEKRRRTASEKTWQDYKIEETTSKLLKMAEKENDPPLLLTQRINLTPKQKLKEEHRIESGNTLVASRSSAGTAKSKIAKNEDETLQIVTDTLQSVKGWYESTDKSEDVEFNFCMTTYSQSKMLSKGKRKMARTKISNIMLDLESD